MKALLVVGGILSGIVLGIFAQDIIALMPTRWQSSGLWLLATAYCFILWALCLCVFGIFEEVPQKKSELDASFRTAQRPPTPPQKTVSHPEPAEESVG